MAIVDQTAAERFWPHEDPIGKQVRMQFGSKPPLRRIVGVVGRSRSDGLDAPYAPHLFVPALQVNLNAMTVYVRTSASPEVMEEPIRAKSRRSTRTCPYSACALFAALFLIP